MQRINPCFLIFLTWLVLSVASASSIGDDGTLRIMTYNIHHCRGIDGKLDIARIATIIRDQQCDLVALQEVDRNTSRSENVDQLAELARLTNMQPYFGKAIDFQGGEYGVAALSKLPVAVYKTMQLPVSENREQRVALELFVTPLQQKPFVFVSTHLDHSAGANDRGLQNKELMRLFGGGPSQAILAGDFNSISDRPELSAILAKWIDVDPLNRLPTIPSRNPARKIDYIFLQKDSPWTVEEVRVLDEPIASDHLPLVTTLRRK